MQFIKIFFVTSFALMTLLLGFITSIDPYDKYGNNPFGFETKAVAMARENKFNMVEHAKKNYEAFIIGSSSAHRIHTDDVKSLTGFETFNYAVQHTTPEDYLAITRHILQKTKPKLILLQMDFYGLNQNFKTDTRFYTSPLKAYLDDKPVPKKDSWFDSDYLTLSAISDSFKVIWVNASGKVRHLYLEDGNYQKEKIHEGPIKITQFSYENYAIDPQRLKLLEQIKDLCQKNQVKLIVWSAPYSYEHVEKILQDPFLKKSLDDYKSALMNVFGEVLDFTNESVKPFNTPLYFSDSTHPTRELFKLVLAKILSSEASELPADFGNIVPKS